MAGSTISTERRVVRAPAVVAVGLVLLGLIATAARLDTPADGSVLRLGWSTWNGDGVHVDVPDPPMTGGLRAGDLVTSVGGHRLADGLGGVADPVEGQVLAYVVVRAGPPAAVPVRMQRPEPYPLVEGGWGNLVFVVALAGLAVALHVRRPDEPATGPLLVTAAGLLGSTTVVVFGLPASALATGGPELWLFHLNVIGAYCIAWGASLAFALRITRDHPWYRGRRGVLAAAYAGPIVLMALWAVVAAPIAGSQLRWIGLLHAGQTAVVAASLLLGLVLAVVSYRHAADAQSRSRLRWLGAGVAGAALLSIAGWHLPELLTGHHPLPSGALGLSALPFVAGIGVALRRHRLFDIERLANRSLVYAGVIAVLVVGYVAAVALLVTGLGISNTVAAAVTAASAALALAPLRGATQRLVNRLMYGRRDDPAGVLADLGSRLQGTLLPEDVAPAVVETVVRSLRVPYAAVDVADGDGGFRLAAERGSPVGAQHTEPLRYQGETVGRLRVSARGRDDPLEPVDLALLGSLAAQAGAAMQAVRLHADLARSRAALVALREDERRRLRRDLHDGLGPGLAAIGLKASLAARAVPAGSAARDLLAQIAAEVRTGVEDVRRLVEALRPPALDELGLVGAVRSRAASLAGELAIEVTGPADLPILPAAVETAAYRIAVEAMTNAVRHSGDRRCTVSIDVRDHDMTVDVHDDGTGPDPAGVPGVGLRAMRERAAEVGGACTVRSPADGGTLVHARLPLRYGGQDDPAHPG